MEERQVVSFSAGLHFSFPLTREKASFFQHRSWNVPFNEMFSIFITGKVHIVREVIV